MDLSVSAQIQRCIKADILVSMTLGKYSADVAMPLTFIPLLRPALLYAGACEEPTLDLETNWDCSSLLDIIRPWDPP
jgi:hypothetical protein